jgi:hypothetical protein
VKPCQKKKSITKNGGGVAEGIRVLSSNPSAIKKKSPLAFRNNIASTLRLQSRYND